MRGSCRRRGFRARRLLNRTGLGRLEEGSSQMLEGVREDPADAAGPVREGRCRIARGRDDVKRGPWQLLEVVREDPADAAGPVREAEH